MAEMAAIGLLFAGTGMSAFGSFMSGQSQQAMFDRNAQIGDIMSTDALTRGREAEIRHRQETKKLIGSQRAAFAASGVEVNDPDSTAENVVIDTAILSEMDALTIRANAAREAWGYKVGAQQDTFKGRIAKQEGINNAIGALTSATSTALYTKYGFGSTTKTRAGK